ncbi:peptidoglycan-binding protein [Canibacter zhoujuaniae]|uniref:peptidoglycan-binding protein n=1 Tax=Canibacter zhoujuaniae TaxID=2708343 RepID=UPI001FBA4324|nr:peptidoglycan-binding protein [Canibacter zhoujuaniae]
MIDNEQAPELDTNTTDEDTNTTDEDASTEPTTKSKKGLSGSKLVAVIAAVALASLLAGVLIMQFIVSPAELAARKEAPEAGPISAPIELRKIENKIITRGEISFADAVAVELDTAGSEERPIITGNLPKVGDLLEAGTLALEVAGRPVVVLPGELPAYRTLKVGMQGPDVLQLKQALASLGYGVGDVTSNLFDAATSEAVAALYRDLGYKAPDGGLEGRKTIRDLERQYSEAQDVEPVDQGLLRDIEEQYRLAVEANMVYLPASEVLYLTDLPRRVDELRVKRGDVLSGSPMSVSGATLSITGTVSKQDAESITVGSTATFVHRGKDYTATVKEVRRGSANTENKDEGSEGDKNSNSGDSSGRYQVVLEPQGLSAEDVTELRGNNVRVTIPIAATESEVLAVPVAAVTAGSGGEDRIELLISKDKGGMETALVEVTTGLAAEGFVEISSTDKRVKEGAKVVVGR